MNMLTIDHRTIDQIGHADKSNLVNTSGLVLGTSKPRQTISDAHLRLNLSGNDQTIELNLWGPSLEYLKKIYDIGLVGLVCVVTKAKVMVRSNTVSLSTNVGYTFIRFYKPGNYEKEVACWQASAMVTDQAWSQFMSTIDMSQYKGVDVPLNRDINPTTTSHQKDALIKDIELGRWYNLTVYLHDAYQYSGDGGDKRVTLWVTDFTKNNELRDHSFNDAGDEGGYLNGGTSLTQNKYGGFEPEMMLEVTLWEHHADNFYSKGPEGGQWWLLKNVKVVLGGDSRLKGEIRATSTFTSDVCTQKLSLGQYNKSEEFKAALERKHQYETGLSRAPGFIDSTIPQTSKEQATTLTPTSPPKDTAEAALNKLTTEYANKESERTEEYFEASNVAVPTHSSLLPDTLNTKIRCEKVTDGVITAISDIIKPATYSLTTREGKTLAFDLPFNVAKYSTVVKIVDYSPDDLKKFTYSLIARRDPEDDTPVDQSIKFDPRFHRKIHKWGFRLKLEDHSVPTRRGAAKSFVWVNVDDEAAQYLLNLAATDLEKDDITLARLKDRMFHLWGRLEEVKRLQAQQVRQGRNNRKRNKLPEDSEDDENPKKPKALESCFDEVAPFQCCIQQYGVVVPTTNESEANAGPDSMYSRQYRLFGTMINSRFCRD